MSFTTLIATNQSTLCLYSAAAGVISHLAYFIRGEHHKQAFRLFQLVFVVPAFLTGAQYLLTDIGFLRSASRSTAYVASFLIALWTSMTLYRVFFHPLRHFPGPFPAKVSKLWHMKMVMHEVKNYLFLDKLHHQYGDFVRTGPSEITIFAPAAMQAVHGPRSKCTKSAWYDRNLPTVSMQSVRDKAVHDRRRRIWDHGFNASSLRAYEGRVEEHSQTLLQQLHSMAGQAVSATKWFHLYGFDVMSDIAFGKSFNMTKTGQMHHALGLLKDSMRGTGTTSAVPWLYLILRHVPGLMNGLMPFLAWCSEQIMQRVRMDKQFETRDVTSWLVEAYEKTPPENRAEAQLWLNGDSRLIIVAGSDTTSATLTYAAYELALHPEHVEKVRKELTALHKTDQGSFDLKDLEKLDHLNAVINETLRLHPPVPSGVYRLTPPEGLTIGNTFIPGGTTVLVPTYTVSRSPNAFERPDDFVPERWNTSPEMVKDKTAFAPFSIGAYSCIGKQLALMELRIVLALIAQDFDIEFAPGEDGSDLVKNSLDTFTMTLQDLHVVFRPRK